MIHLAAQAGVRHSIENPASYVQSNLVGFANMLEACRRAETPHLTYASTSSVYGANTTMPFEEGQGVDHPLQLYAATKRANELMAHSYAHLYRLPCTGLRFFTVYGPWGRPDMAPMKFADAILEGRPIQVFNHGRHSRDFTYVDDIVEGVIRASDALAAPDPDWDPADPDPATSDAPFRIWNIGAAGTRRTRRFHRRARGGLGKEGRPGTAAAPARRRARHLGRQLAAHARDRLAAPHVGEGGRAALRASGMWAGAAHRFSDRIFRRPAPDPGPRVGRRCIPGGRRYEEPRTWSRPTGA